MKQEKEEWHGEDRRAESRSVLVAEITAAFREEIASLTVPEAIHRQHHEFIGAYLEEQRIKRERREKVKTHVFGWVIISVLGSIGTGAYHAFQFLKEHWK